MPAAHPAPGVAPTPPEVLAGLRPAWVDVDLDHLEANLRWLRRRSGEVRALAVLKADAYGHGAVPVARALAGAVDLFGVALVEEGVELRQAGVDAPVLVLGTVQPAQAELVEEHGLVPTVSSGEQLRMWVERTAARATPLGVHLKVDTGMARLGVPAEELGEALGLLRAASGLRLDGVLSHLAEAEALASPSNAAQAARFEEVLATLRPDERERVVVHLANSAGAIHHAGMRHGMVRLGLALYGLDPAGEATEAELRPVMSVRARVVQVRSIAAGSAIGYGGRWTAARPSRVGVVPVGYADGYPWRLSNRSAALVAGRRVPVVGAVSMDMLYVDLTDCGETGVGEAVTLMGEAGSERLGARELAQWAGTIPWELLCLLGLRLPRCSVRGGRVVEVRSRLANRIAEALA